MALMYAAAFDYAVFYMCEHLLAGADTAGAGTTLTDAAATFLTTEYLEAGMPLYNATTNEYGKIVTVVSNTTLLTDITWSLGDLYQIAKVSADTVAMIESYLRIGAGDINAVRSAAGAASCAISEELDMYMRKLNVVGAAVLHNCPCARPNLSDGMRQALLMWMNEQLDAIRTGKLELCSGYTGSAYPYIAIAQPGWTDWRRAEILIDRILRTGV